MNAYDSIALLTASVALATVGVVLAGRLAGRAWMSPARAIGILGGLASLLVVVLLAMSGAMVGGSLLFLAVLGATASAFAGIHGREGRPIETFVLVGFLLVVDLLLGVTYLAATGGALVAGSGGLFSNGVSVLSAPAFLVAASVEIAVAGVFGRPDLDPRVRTLLVGQSALVLLSPTLVAASGWPPISALLGSSAFVALFVVALQFVYRTKQLTPSLSRFLVRWSIAGTILGAGWFAWLLYGSSLVLAGGVVAELLVALTAVLAPAPSVSETRLPWLMHPFWVFQILLFTFLAEFFLGALLDLVITGPAFLQYIPFVPYSGTPLDVLGQAFYNALWFAAAILASAWFLIVLGFTMGMLVVFKMRETRDRPLRQRMALMLGVYALAVIYIPSLASSTPIANSPTLQTIPLLGWGFGLRAGGPFESTVFFAILLMFAAVAVLTVLFGRKALCAVMCGAALVYQGTTMHEMREFNRTSRVGRYFLGSQLSTAYLVLSSVALISLFAVSILGILHLLPSATLPNGEVDTATLPLPVMLYFGGLWFAMFVSVPYVGTYNCASTGLCHWGAFSIPFAKVSLFALKVKDRKVCQACTTFDCAKSCPVGLVDMPLAFRTKGEYRSTKCCGVGTCVGACPYGNMYHQDVRFWLRRRTTRSPLPAGGTPLPMAAPPSVPAARSSDPPTASTSHL